MKPRTYWHTLVNTFSAPHYYLHVLNAKFSFSLRFFLTSCFLLTIISTFLFAKIDAPKYRYYINQGLSEFEQHYPEKLQIDWDTKELHSNVNEPVFVRYPSFSDDFVDAKNVPKTLGLISTAQEKPDDITQQASTSAFFVMTKDKLYMNRVGGNWTSASLTELDGFGAPFSVNKSNLHAHIENWKTIGENAITLLTYAHPFVFFLQIVIGGLLVILFHVLFIYYLLMLFRRPLPFQKIFQIGLHVFVVAKVADMIAHYMFHPRSFPLFVLTFVVYMSIIIRTLWAVTMMPRTPKNIPEDDDDDFDDFEE